MASEGWIKLYRNIQEHWIWQDPIKLKWWLDILLLANHKGNKILLGNDIKEVKRGCYHTSEVKLAERWNVDRKTVRRFLELLEKDNMIIVEKSKKGTTLEISNYNKFQDFSASQKDNQEDNTRDNEVPTERTDKSQHDGQISPNRRDTNNNDKNIKNDKEGEEREEGQEEKPFPPILSTHQILIKEQFGDVAYKTWFCNCEIAEYETVVNIKVKDEFNRNVILQKYKSTLEKLFNKRIELEVMHDEFVSDNSITS